MLRKIIGRVSRRLWALRGRKAVEAAHRSAKVGRHDLIRAPFTPVRNSRRDGDMLARILGGIWRDRIVRIVGRIDPNKARPFPGPNDVPRAPIYVAFPRVVAAGGHGVWLVAYPASRNTDDLDYLVVATQELGTVPPTIAADIESASATKGLSLG